MHILVIFASLLAVAYSAPVEEQTVNVKQDTHGNYKFYYQTNEATRIEEGHADGSVSGSVTYVDGDGTTQTIKYTSGVEGYKATGAIIPEPVKESAEVAHSRSEHRDIFHIIEKSLPPLKEDGTVDEVPITPLSKDEFLASIASVLHRNTPLKFLEDTPEVVQAKVEHYNAQVNAFER